MGSTHKLLELRLDSFHDLITGRISMDLMNVFQCSVRLRTVCYRLVAMRGVEFSGRFPFAGQSNQSLPIARSSLVVTRQAGRLELSS